MKRVKITTEDFITKAKEVHGDKYDYSNVEYVNTNVKVCIICPEHGEFWQAPNKHLIGQGCVKCFKRIYDIDSFIKEAKKVHGNKYDYSKVEYVNSQTKVCIICPEHGEFWQTPIGHIKSSNGCQKCAGNIKLDTEDFITKAKEIHGDKYDYSKVEYKNNQTNICIICPEHGEFWQTPINHLKGFGCKKCSGMFLDKNTFIERATLKHNGKYDYSKVDYKNNRTKVIIICPEHGEFYQNPRTHLKGVGCPKCNGGVKFTQEEFLKKAKEVHGNKYDYSKVEYKNCNTKVCIICPEHGEFLQSPNKHLRGQKCPKCSGVAKSNTDEFIKKSKEVHGDKYDYSETIYIAAAKKVKIICPLHGEFYMTGNNHLRGQGCPICGCSASKMELAIKSFLEDNNIKYIPQHSFDWLKYENPLKLDFYLPEYNIAIECQGEQHFRPIDFFGGEQGYELTVKRDIIKLNLCKEHNINILYFTNENVSVPKKWEHYKVIKSLDKLLKKIYK